MPCHAYLLERKLTIQRAMLEPRILNYRPKKSELVLLPHLHSGSVCLIGFPPLLSSPRTKGKGGRGAHADDRLHDDEREIFFLSFSFCGRQQATIFIQSSGANERMNERTRSLNFHGVFFSILVPCLLAVGVVCVLVLYWAKFPFSGDDG
ncbi:uncharacterized protein LY89DRAFT_50459 [Mollisia scopiformis]|uniref:Uncharacterized protein n=1 Tax=Mollisia scopiformis TaxID=149040 RepID=A0A194XAV7_MOLSC|nr:uncharacterized protein LY89DRAFT_50459 [Mollisia scopiformis]KUJ17306.1 hypothetical protein LY89DRAFT_50459 [Mollisia scopiformis]